MKKKFNQKYWRNGFIDIRHLGKEGNSNIALYVSTYIVKSLQNTNLDGYRIYSYSHRTLNKPIEEKFYTTEKIDSILSRFNNYYIKYTSSYEIGYMDYKRNHKGNVTYIDMILKK